MSTHPLTPADVADYLHGHRFFSVRKLGLRLAQADGRGGACAVVARGGGFIRANRGVHVTVLAGEVKLEGVAGQLTYTNDQPDCLTENTITLRQYFKVLIGDLGRLFGLEEPTLRDEVSACSYYVMDHRNMALFISPLTGQLLTIGHVEEKMTVLNQNGLFASQVHAHDCASVRLSHSCRIPPAYRVARSKSPSPPQKRSSIRDRLERARLMFSGPMSVAHSLARIRQQEKAHRNLHEVLEQIARSSRFARGECFFKSRFEGQVLRSFGIPFRLVYGVLSPSNLMHAWIEVDDENNQTWLINENEDHVNCFQTSLRFDFLQARA